MGDFFKKHKYLIIIILFIIIAICTFFLFFKPETDEQKEWRKLSESISKSYNEVKNSKDYIPYYKDERQKITLIDFSSMSQEEIKEWCKQNKITYVFTSEYSEFVPKDAFIRQSVQSGDYVYEGGNINVVYSLGKKPTKEQSNALKKAQSYASTMYMSKQGIYEQLVSEYGEGFTPESAQYAIDNLNVDWNANALKKAKSYQDNLNMSKKAIYDQLISSYGEQFTEEEAQYAIDNLEN